MRRIGFKYHLGASITVAASLLLAILCVFCCAQKTDREGNTVSDSAGKLSIPISRAQIPLGLVGKDEKRTQEFLKFFKTPTAQYIPLGLYAMVSDIRDSEKLKALGRRGIILFHKYSSEQDIPDAVADLRSAQKAGVAILQNLPSKYLLTRDERFWQQHILALAANDQILVWYLPEETKMEHLDKLEQIAEIIRVTDNKRRPIITYVESPIADYLRRVDGITDAVVFGAYPSYYGVRPRIEIKRRIDHAYRSGVHLVIAALEALKGKKNWTRPKDVRFDAYLALISGAKGIMWYLYDQAKQQPQLLEAVLAVATELNGPQHLGEVLLLGIEPNLVSCKMVEGPAYFHSDLPYGTKPLSSIQWTARKYEKELYIFAVNTAQVVDAVDDGGKACVVKVEFGPVGNASEVQVVGEERQIKLLDGCFVDTFEPLGTHIYRIMLN